MRFAYFGAGLLAACLFTPPAVAQTQQPLVVQSQPLAVQYPTEPRWPLVGGGAGLFLASYGILAFDAVSILSSSNGFSAPWLIPVAGPFIALATTSWCGTPFGCEFADYAGFALLVLDGLAQIGGVAMFVAGFAYPRRRRGYVVPSVTTSHGVTTLGVRAIF